MICSLTSAIVHADELDSFHKRLKLNCQTNVISRWSFYQRFLTTDRLCRPNRSLSHSYAQPCKYWFWISGMFFPSDLFETAPLAEWVLERREQVLSVTCLLYFLWSGTSAHSWPVFSAHSTLAAVRSVMLWLV